MAPEATGIKVDYRIFKKKSLVMKLLNKLEISSYSENFIHNYDNSIFTPSSFIPSHLIIIVINLHNYVHDIELLLCVTSSHILKIRSLDISL